MPLENRDLTRPARRLPLIHCGGFADGRDSGLPSEDFHIDGPVVSSQATHSPRRTGEIRTGRNRAMRSATDKRRNRRCSSRGLALACTVFAAMASCSPDYNLWAWDAGPIASAASAREEPTFIVGELTTLTERRLTVETPGDEVALGITDAVQITIDGKQARLGDLQPRQFVEVETEREGQELLASVITARSRMR
jgi:hypothetical protein